MFLFLAAYFATRKLVVCVKARTLSITITGSRKEDSLILATSVKCNGYLQYTGISTVQ